MTTLLQHFHPTALPHPDADPVRTPVISDVLPRLLTAVRLGRSAAASRPRREGTDPALRGLISGRTETRGARGALA